MQAIIKNPGRILVKNQVRTRTHWLERLKEKYALYIQEQDKRKVLWYLKVVLIMTNVHMILSTFAMAELVDKFEYYIGFTVLVFFTNIMVHIVQLRSNVYVPVYYISLALMIIIPITTYIITLFS